MRDEIVETGRIAESPIGGEEPVEADMIRDWQHQDPQYRSFGPGAASYTRDTYKAPVNNEVNMARGPLSGVRVIDVTAVLTNAVRYLEPADSLAAQVLDAARHLLPLGSPRLPDFPLADRGRGGGTRRAAHGAPQPHLRARLRAAGPARRTGRRPAAGGDLGAVRLASREPRHVPIDFPEAPALRSR